MSPFSVYLIADVLLRYTRSSMPTRSKKSEVLETRNEVSHEYSKIIQASDEGLYEVVSIRDQHCSYSSQKAHGKESQKLLKIG